VQWPLAVAQELAGKRRSRLRGRPDYPRDPTVSAYPASSIEDTFEFDRRRSSREAYLVRRVARRATHSIVADVDPADPDAVVRATPLPTPFAAQTAFPVPIVAMPPARAALARAMATVDLNQIMPHTTGLLVEVHRSGVGS